MAECVKSIRKCPDCGGRIEIPRDIIECSGCNSIFYLSCPFHKGNISQSSTRPNVKIWTCCKCSAITPIPDYKGSDDRDVEKVFFSKMENSGKCYLCGKTDGDLSDITTRSNGKCDMLGHISDPSNAQSQGTKSASNDSTVLGGSDPPSTPEKESDVANTEACNECKSALRAQLPELPCSGCKEVFYVVCYVHPNKTDFSEVPKEAKIRWKCNTCFKCPEGPKIGWKCPTCFARDSFCGSCEKPAENPSHILRCKKCQQVYDSSCVGVKIEKFRQMTPEQKDKWQCKPCILGKVKETAKKIGIPLAVGAGLTAAVLGGIPLVVAGLGFGSAGVVGGSLAAAYQSAFLGGNIVAGSVFSVLQSVGAAGLVGSTQAGISGVCMAIPFLGSKRKGAQSDKKESKSFIFLIKDHQIYRVLVSLS